MIGRDGEIWLHLIKRDVPNWETKPHEPKDPKNWWKVYKKLKEQTLRDREQGAEKLKAALDSINDEKEQKLAKVVPRKDLPKAPTNHRARTLYTTTVARPEVGRDTNSVCWRRSERRLGTHDWLGQTFQLPDW